MEIEIEGGIYCSHFRTSELQGRQEIRWVRSKRWN